MGRPPSFPKSVSVTVKCPNCGVSSTFTIKIPRPKLKMAQVTCLECGHQWTYKGTLTRRVECPRCGSTKNEVNRKVFGKWKGPK